MTFRPIVGWNRPTTWPELQTNQPRTLPSLAAWSLSTLPIYFFYYYFWLCQLGKFLQTLVMVIIRRMDLLMRRIRLLEPQHEFSKLVWSFLGIGNISKCRHNFHLLRWRSLFENLSHFVISLGDTIFCPIYDSTVVLVCHEIAYAEWEKRQIQECAFKLLSWVIQITPCSQEGRRKAGQMPWILSRFLVLHKLWVHKQIWVTTKIGLSL